MQQEMMPRAREVDATIRKIAEQTPHKWDEFKRQCPVGSEGWFSFMWDVMCAAHNLRIISMDRRNELIQEVYVVWTGDTSSDSE